MLADVALRSRLYSFAYFVLLCVVQTHTYTKRDTLSHFVLCARARERESNTAKEQHSKFHLENESAREIYECEMRDCAHIDTHTHGEDVAARNFSISIGGCFDFCLHFTVSTVRAPTLWAGLFSLVRLILDVAAAVESSRRRQKRRARHTDAGALCVFAQQEAKRRMKRDKSNEFCVDWLDARAQRVAGAIRCASPIRRRRCCCCCCHSLSVVLVTVRLTIQQLRLWRSSVRLAAQKQMQLPPLLLLQLRYKCGYLAANKRNNRHNRSSLCVL